MASILDGIPAALPDELTTVLLTQSGVRIERIVSTGHRSDPGFWYDQDEGEWVLVLRGAGRIRFADPDEVVELGVGEHVYIPPHRRHRVEWTTETEPTVWLAVFLPASQGGATDARSG